MSSSACRSAEEMRQQVVVDFYLLAKGVVIGEGFGDEIAWQNHLRLSALEEEAFLREAAWVVLSSGMREAVVRQKFDAISAAFHSWTSAKTIRRSAPGCRARAVRVFGHLRKIDSIIEIARMTDREGFAAIKRRIERDGISFLRSLPYIGPTTCYHLAKNIGLDVVKPDRHLLRISSIMGYANPMEFCKSIASAVGDRLSVVDVVVWRYATLNPGYREFLLRYIN